MSSIPFVPGQRFGRLTAVEDTSRPDPSTGRRRRYWRCLCDCGGEILARPHDLAGRRKTVSCGCIQHRDGRFGASLYSTWRNIIARCRRPRCPRYPDYGGRGITLCPEWDDYNQFVADMGPRPSPAHTIDRKDNDGPYSPENCRWATEEEQQSNKRTNHLISALGRTQTLTQWAAELDVSESMIRGRLDDGWDAARAIFTPPTRFKDPSVSRTPRTDPALCPQGHPFTDVYTAPNGNQFCRVCRKEAASRLRARRKQSA